MKDTTEDKHHRHYHHHHHNHHHNLPFHQRICSKLSLTYLRNYKSTSYIILLILVYILGYFTASPLLPSTKLFPFISTVNNHFPATSLSILDKKSDHNKFGPKCVDPVPPELVRSTILSRVFNNVSPYDNFPPTHLAGLLRNKSVIGWGSYGAVFENVIRKTRPKTIIEVGTFFGASATHMAELTRTLGLDTQILCVDDFRGWPGFLDLVKDLPMQNGDVLLMAQFMQNVVTLNYSEYILPVPFSSGITLKRLCEWGVMADLIEVDAGHDFHSAWLDINLAYKLLRPGGVIFGHDYFNGYDRKGVRRAVKLFAKVHGFNVSVDGEHWVIE